MQAGIGDLLQVKPILELWDGGADVCARVRGRKKSFQEVIERLQKFYGDRPIHAGMLHANALADAEQLLVEARQALNIQEAYYSDIGPAIAALAGPGVVGLAGLSGRCLTVLGHHAADMIDVQKDRVIRSQGVRTG